MEKFAFFFIFSSVDTGTYRDYELNKNCQLCLWL